MSTAVHTIDANNIELYKQSQSQQHVAQSVVGSYEPDVTTISAAIPADTTVLMACRDNIVSHVTYGNLQQTKQHQPTSTTQHIDVTTVGVKTLSQAAQYQQMAVQSPPVVLSARVTYKYNYMTRTVKARVLLDEGAGSSFVSQSYIDQYNIPTSSIDTMITARMANDSYSSIKLQCNLTMSIQSYSHNISLLVLPNMPHYDVILGKNWLVHVKAITNHANKYTRIKYNNTNIILYHSQYQTNIVLNSLSISAHKFKNLIKSKRQCKQHQIYVMHLIDIHSIDNGSSNDEFSNKLHNIISNNYSDILDNIPPGVVPSRAGVDHTIELVPGAKPPNQPAYRASNSHNDELKRQIDELLQMRFIRPSTSPYSSPVLFVKKKDGSMRMCIDYRALNKVTVKNKYPLPHTDELFERLTNANYMSKLDLRSGYHQIRMSEDSIAKTAFTTRYGLYEYVVMPFGLCNAPATFMAMMNNILRSELDKCVIVYLDDILIYSGTQEQHIKDVCHVFDILKQHELYVKLSKCEFGKTQVEFLGHVVGGGNISMAPDKVRVVQDWPTPKSPHELRQFLGMCNYYRKFIKNYSENS